ncbi:MAG: ATP-dependent DNA helicase RecG [Anaerolineales bacterium]
MQPSLEKLRKFFRLEAEQGYENRAIIGGFARIADSWEAEARQEQLPEDLIEAIGARLRSYHLLSPASRQEALYGLWRRIQRLTGETPPQEVQPESAAPPKDDSPSRAAAPPARAVRPSPQGESAALQGKAPQETTPPPEAPAPAAALPETPAVPVITFTELDAPLTSLRGIGPRNVQNLESAGIHSLQDLLYYFPRRYVDFSTLKNIRQLRYGDVVTVIGTVTQVQTRQIVRGKARQVVEAFLDDGSGVLRLSWFNQPWVAKQLQGRPQISASGKVDQYLGRLVMTNPEWEALSQEQLSTNRIVPVYPLTASLSQKWLRGKIHAAVQTWAPRVPDPLPADLRQEAGLLPLPVALEQIHYPSDDAHLQAARYRLGFDEIFLLQLGLLARRQAWKNGQAPSFEMPADWLETRLQSLPFALTGAQRRALDDILSDMAQAQPMNRLLQGDVGSGKTVVAALAMAAAVHHQAQAALMAPTSILAEQHLKNMRRFLCGEQGLLREDEIRLMVGATPDGEKAEIRAGLESGAILVVIGTHTLIEDNVQFANLGLVVIDEQHRFGVQQRGALRQKGAAPHLLVMTATPIPRSLALTIYGDLDLTVMDEMPPGRQPVQTFVVSPRDRERAYNLIRNEIERGRQAFIIYPLVEEREDSESKAAVDEHARLQTVFPQLNLGLLHGRMRPAEKEAVMADFRDGKYHILVSTSVVEVGVDVPNATVMLIEGANRFGLAQLHQFRGRVGRGAHTSYCILIPDNSEALENERLQAMAETEDGFVLAERDLAQRGPGEFLGTRQSGLGENLHLANLNDVRLIEKARYFAQQVFSRDPDLQNPQHALLAQAITRFWQHTIPTDVS